jgi:hypothetical protein
LARFCLYGWGTGLMRTYRSTTSRSEVGRRRPRRRPAGASNRKKRLRVNPSPRSGKLSPSKNRPYYPDEPHVRICSLSHSACRRLPHSRLGSASVEIKAPPSCAQQSKRASAPRAGSAP